MTTKRQQLLGVDGPRWPLPLLQARSAWSTKWVPVTAKPVQRNPAWKSKTFQQQQRPHSHLKHIVTNVSNLSLVHRTVFSTYGTALETGTVYLKRRHWHAHSVQTSPTFNPLYYVIWMHTNYSGQQCRFRSNSIVNFACLLGFCLFTLITVREGGKRLKIKCTWPRGG